MKPYLPAGKPRLLLKRIQIHRKRSEKRLPSTFWVRVALMMISVLMGVTLTSTPEYPSSASSLVSTSFNSAKKTPSATNYSEKKIPKIAKKKKKREIRDCKNKTEEFEWGRTNLSLLTHLSRHNFRSRGSRGDRPPSLSSASTPKTLAVFLELFSTLL